MKLHMLCGGALRNGIGALVPEHPHLLGPPLSTSCIEATGKRQLSVNQEVGAHWTPAQLAPWMAQPLELVRNTFLLFEPPCLWYLVTAA